MTELNKWWQESTKCVPATKLNATQIGEFFAHLNAHTAYSITIKNVDIPILDRTGKLLICLDFQNHPYDPVALTKSFNGDYHTIYQIKPTSNGVQTGFFSTIETTGSIQHLTLSDVTIDASSSKTTTHVGALAGSNKGGALLDVHLKGTNTLTTSDAVLFVGGMIGENKGTLTKLSVSGQLTMTNGVAANAVTHIGGMIGSTSQSLNGCVVSAAAKITVTGTDTKDAHIGGLIGTGEASNTTTIENCFANTHLDATDATADHLYVGGLVGSAECQIKDCSASGYVIGGKGASEAATGGLLGYVDHADITRYPTNCSATGDVTAGIGEKAIYTGGLIGRSVISLKNCSSVGKVKQSAATTQYTGGLIGMIAADKLIYNSFSMSKLFQSDGKELQIAVTSDNKATNDARLCGLRPETKTRNCHYQGYLLNDKGGNTTITEKVKASYLNKSVNDANNYLTWSFNANTWGGAPYLIYKQNPVK
ncbi:MAG: GLUG motif-containing protein [Tannerellaceae bacterium]